jgi:hypothetical protein
MENNTGWIKLHRIIMDHADWLAEPFTRAQAWVDLLLLANHKIGHIRKRGILIEVQRGQVGYSEETLAARWKWSRNKTRRFLSCLRVAGQISRNPVQQNPKLSCLISIINYDSYQSGDTTDDTTERQQKVQEQECKKKKNIKTFLSNSDEIRLSELLLEKLLSRNPNYKRPNIQIWAKDVDRMIRIEHRSPEEIQAVIEWCQSDLFWQNNILSVAKLRSQFDQLQLKMGTSGKKTAPVPSSPAIICPRCGRELVVKNDLYGEGCIHCERTLEARA